MSLKKTTIAKYQNLAMRPNNYVVRGAFASDTTLHIKVWRTVPFMFDVPHD